MTGSARIFVCALAAWSLAASPAPAAMSPSAAVEKLLDPAKEFNVIVFVPSWWILSDRFKKWETGLDDYRRLRVRVLILDKEEEARAYGLRVYPTVLIYREAELAGAYESMIPEVGGRARWIFDAGSFLGPVLWELGGPAVRFSGEPEWLTAEMIRARSERAAKLKELERRLSLPTAVLVEPGQGLPTAEEAFRFPWANEPAHALLDKNQGQGLSFR